MIRLSGIRKSFKVGETQKEVLKGIDLEIKNICLHLQNLIILQILEDLGMI